MCKVFNVPGFLGVLPDAYLSSVSISLALMVSDSSSWLSAGLSKPILKVMEEEDSFWHPCKQQHIAVGAVAKK